MGFGVKLKFPTLHKTNASTHFNQTTRTNINTSNDKNLLQERCLGYIKADKLIRILDWKVYSVVSKAEFHGSEGLSVREP